MDALYDNKNEYLRSLMNPWTGGVRIPDLNMTSGVPKRVEITRTVNTGQSRQMLLVYLPHNRTAPLWLYLWNDSANSYFYNRTIPYDQLIAEKYDLSRFVSGGLCVKSNTVSTGNSDISGTISAVHFQRPPALLNLSYNQVSSYKRNRYDVQTGTSAQDGIISLANPNGSHMFRPENTDSVTSTDARLNLDAAYNFGDPFNAPWSDTSTGERTFFFAFRGDSYLPENFFGKFSISYSASFLMPAAVVAANVQVVLTISYDTISNDSLTVNQVDLVDSAYNRRLPLASPESITFTGERCFISPAPIKAITLELQGLPPGEDPDLFYGSVCISSYDYYQEGFLGPGALIALNGINSDQQIELKGVGNYEVVPNAELSQELTTNYGKIQNPMDMEMAEAFLSIGYRHGWKMLWNKKEYESRKAIAMIEQMSDNKVLAKATGFTDFLARVMKMVTPILAQNAPMIGGMIAGPQGALVGNAIRQSLSTRPHRGQASGVYSMDMSRMYTSALIDSDLDSTVEEIVRNSFSRGSEVEIRAEEVADVSHLNHRRKGLPYQNWKAKFVSGRGLDKKDNSLVVNSFPVVLDGDIKLCNIYASTTPIGDLRGNEEVLTYTYFSTSDDKEFYLHSLSTITSRSMNYILSAYLESPSNYVYDTTFCVVSFRSLSAAKAGIDGGSLSLAAWCTFSNLWLGIPITGAYVLDKIYQASDVVTKTSGLNKIQELLISAIDTEGADLQLQVQAKLVSYGNILNETGAVNSPIPISNVCTLNMLSLMSIPTGPNLKTTIHKERTVEMYRDKQKTEKAMVDVPATFTIRGTAQKRRPKKEVLETPRLNEVSGMSLEQVIGVLDSEDFNTVDAGGVLSTTQFDNMVAKVDDYVTALNDDLTPNATFNRIFRKTANMAKIVLQRKAKLRGAQQPKKRKKQIFRPKARPQSRINPRAQKQVNIPLLPDEPEEIGGEEIEFEDVSDL